MYTRKTRLIETSNNFFYGKTYYILNQYLVNRMNYKIYKSLIKVKIKRYPLIPKGHEYVVWPNDGLKPKFLLY